MSRGQKNVAAANGRTRLHNDVKGTVAKHLVRIDAVQALYK